MHGTNAVLIQHQKARHFKCHLCPRRLNTAGGLAVHLGQVHKAEPGSYVHAHSHSLENTLPGRSSFDIEIYGMVGVPEPDLREWMARRGARQAQQGAAPQQPAPKRPKIDKTPLTAEQLRAQLEAHKALMSGLAPSTPYAPMYGASVPPPAAVAPPTVPPPTVPPPAPQPVPPPTAAAPAPAPPADAPPAPAPSTEPSAPLSEPPVPPPEPPAADTPAAPAAPAPAPAKPQKSRLAYTDTVLSPDEKRAQLPRYAYVEPDARSVQAGAA